MTKKRAKERKPPIVLPTKKSIVGVTLQDVMGLFYGPPKVGKTTFVNGLAPKVLFLSTDRGTRSQAALRLECHNYLDFVDAVKALKQGKAQYDIICIDHLSDLADYAEQYVCDELGINSLQEADWGQGWKEYKRALLAIIGSLKSLNCGLMFITHEQIKTIRTRTLELERTMPRLQKTAWDLVIPMVDIIGYCGFRTVKKGGKRQEIRVLETSPREDLYAGDRTVRSKRSGIEMLDSKLFIASFQGVGSNGETKVRKVGKRVR